MIIQHYLLQLAMTDIHVLPMHVQSPLPILEIKYITRIGVHRSGFVFQITYVLRLGRNVTHVQSSLLGIVLKFRRSGQAVRWFVFKDEIR